MLGWFQEDYVAFVKECEKTIDKIKLMKQEGARDWSDVLLELAQHQICIARYMAGSYEE